MKIFFTTLLVLLSLSAHSIELDKCFNLEGSAPESEFQIPKQVCIGIADVVWRFDYPVHDFYVSGTFNKKTDLNDFGLTENDLWLVEANLNEQRIQTKECFMKKGAFIKFRFEVSDDTLYFENLNLRAEIIDTDDFCRRKSIQVIKYKLAE